MRCRSKCARPVAPKLVCKVESAQDGHSAERKKQRKGANPNLSKTWFALQGKCKPDFLPGPVLFRGAVGNLPAPGGKGHGTKIKANKGCRLRGPVGPKSGRGNPAKKKPLSYPPF